jgi:hypothetical protein
MGQEIDFQALLNQTAKTLGHDPDKGATRHQRGERKWRVMGMAEDNISFVHVADGELEVILSAEGVKVRRLSAVLHRNEYAVPKSLLPAALRVLDPEAIVPSFEELAHLEQKRRDAGEKSGPKLKAAAARRRLDKELEKALALLSAEEVQEATNLKITALVHRS